MFKRFMLLSTAAGVLALSLATVGFLVTASYGAVGDVHDAAAEWDTNNNPNGNWDYLNWDLLGNFYATSNNGTALTQQSFFGRNFWATSADAGVNSPPNCCLVEAGSFFNTPNGTRSNLRLAPNGPLSVQWTAPVGVAPGVEVYVSTEQIFEASRQQRVVIQKNGSPFGIVEVPSDGTNSLLQVLGSLTQNTSIAAGDTLNFIMDPYGQFGNGITTLHMTEVVVTEIPEPASLMLLGVGGALAMATCRRRRQL